MAEIPEPVVAAQCAADQAWAAVEAYRQEVDANRRTTAQPPTERHRSPELRPWTEKENAEYDRLHRAAVEAAKARAEVMRAEGVASTWDSERDMRKAARGEAE